MSFGLDFRCEYIHRLSVARKDDAPDLLFPFDDQQVTQSPIVCPNPKCRNDGMDGSITGRSGQWGLQRECKKCGQKWGGGIGVQRADFSEPMPVPGQEPSTDDIPQQNLNPSFRDPKNDSGDR